MTRPRISRLGWLLLAAAIACAHKPPESATAPCPSSDRFVQTRAGPVFVETAGQGSDVVLIHGGLIDRRLWNRQFCELARRFRVTRYDLPGFGRSAKPAAKFSYVDNLDDVLHASAIPRASLVGLSLGGGIATEFAIHHPGAVERLVLISASLPGFPAPVQPASAAVYQELRSNGVDSAVAAWLRHPFFERTARDPENRELLRAMLRENESAWANGPADVDWPTPPAQQRLGEIRAPTLVITGADDIAHIRAIGDTLLHRIGGATLRVVEGADHHLPLANASWLNRELTEFLDANRSH